MRLGLDRLWLYLALALPALASLIVPLAAVDLAYHLRAGELILGTGSIPTTDTFTFTVAGAAWLDQQWLAQVLFALVHRLGGWELLAVVRAALVTATFGFVVLAAMARGATVRTAAILALVAFMLSAPALALRPQLIGIVLFAALLWLVADGRRHPRRLWLAPVLVVAWANVHGSVVLAPVLLGYAWLEDLVEHDGHRRTFAVLLVGTIATLVNPFGGAVWGYAAGIGANPEITGQVAEWQRTTPFTVPGLLFYVSAAAVAGLLVLRRGSLPWPLVLWLVTLFVLGAWTVRGLAWWPLGAAVSVAGLLTSAEPARRPRANALNVVVAGVVAVAIVAALPWWRPADPLAGRTGLVSYAPSELAQALRGMVEPGDHIFVPQAWGSWFEWSVPEARVFVDSRIELFPAEVWHDYDTVASGGTGWEHVLDDRAVTEVVVASDDLVARTMRAAGGWCRAYADEAGAIYRRVGPTNLGPMGDCP